MLDFLKKIIHTLSSKVIHDKSFELRHREESAEQENQEVRFARAFSLWGGRFLYCSSLKEALHFIKHIVCENQIAQFWCPEARLQNYLKSLSLLFKEVPEKGLFNLISCEYLIAKDGSVMLSSDQMFGRKLSELSNDFIVFASSNQIVDTVDDALHRIKAFKADCIPVDITTIRANNSSEFYWGSEKKNIYLLFTDYV